MRRIFDENLLQETNARVPVIDSFHKQRNRCVNNPSAITKTESKQINRRLLFVPDDERTERVSNRIQIITLLVLL